VVTGIARMENMKELGRVGLRALLYFEVVSTLALVVGLVVVDVFKPGAGMNIDIATLDTSSLATYTSAVKHASFMDFVMNIIPDTIVDTFAKGNVLQILLFSILLGIALAHVGPRGKAFVDTLDSLMQGMFRIVNMVMRLAPIGAFGAIAFTIGNGVGTMAIAKWVGALDTVKMNKALNGEVEEERSAVGQADRIFAHSAVEERSVLPDLKKASRA
jgi:DAACS family dicarboxylate/amino acid:cation (Na+ or H+) symporter/aerobic C4-dicarboxylate transport protein